MSTLEKTIDLLEDMPDDKIETVYAFVRFINSDTHESPSEHTTTKTETIQSMLGIAHEYANPALIEQGGRGFIKMRSGNLKKGRCHRTALRLVF